MKKEKAPAMPEVGPGLWRTETDGNVLEVIKVPTGYKATKTRKSDRGSETIGEFETLAEAVKALKK